MGDGVAITTWPIVFDFGFTRIEFGLIIGFDTGYIHRDEDPEEPQYLYDEEGDEYYSAPECYEDFITLGLGCLTISVMEWECWKDCAQTLWFNWRNK